MGISMQDSKLDELVRLISAWPGLMARPDRALVDDGLVLLEYLGKARRLVDVGSGAGLPGVPIKIARPDLDVTLIEADQAKAAFLVHACASLGLDHVEVVARRAEEAGHDPRLREAFDVAVARALAPLPVLVELCLPLLGGELSGVLAAPSAARSAGTVIVVAKVRPTPSPYPRRAGVPARKPL